MSPESSVMSARKSPVERMKASGRGTTSGEDSWLLSRREIGDLEPMATGVDSPSVDIGSEAASTCSMAVANESQLPDPSPELDRLARMASETGGERVACCPPKIFIASPLTAWAREEAESGVTGWLVLAPTDACSFGGEVGGEGAQYLESERWVWTSGILGAKNDSGVADGIGNSDRNSGSLICDDSFGNTQLNGPTARELSDAPKGLLIFEAGETLQFCLRPSRDVA